MKSGRINSKKSKVNGRPFVRDFLNRHYNKNHGIIFVFDNTANNNKREKSQSCFSSGIIFSLCLNIKLSIQTFFQVSKSSGVPVIAFLFYFLFKSNGASKCWKTRKNSFTGRIKYLSLSLFYPFFLSLFLSLSDLDIFCLIYFALGVLQFNRMWIFSSLK